MIFELLIFAKIQRGALNNVVYIESSVSHIELTNILKNLNMWKSYPANYYIL